MPKSFLILLSFALFVSACKSGDKNFVPPDQEKKENALIITRTFEAPRAAVWKAWTETKSVKQWWGPLPFTCPYAKIDLKVGGKYLLAMRSPDKKDYWSTGNYLEIVPEKKIVATDSFSNKNGEVVSPEVYGMPKDMPRELLVTVTFEDDGPNKTKLTLRHAGMPKSMEGDARVGWMTSLDKLKKLVEK